ncbi:hypothetical protein niasHT_032478 [Heterodera trifolii]|uniref:ShKT domain-containing protein n=1 Tax=Heterodera trifolii TaxID=157864 RepID=A0ABD2INU0_9BILA
MFSTKNICVSLFCAVLTTVFIWGQYGNAIATTAAGPTENGRPDIFDLLSNIAETVQNKGRNNVPKHLPPALPLPRAIDIKRVPFTLPSGTDNIRAMRRCQFSNGTLWPSATDCDDELGSGACETIFFGNKEQFRHSKESPRPLTCLNKELSDLTRRCAKTCAFCCETPQFNCMDSGGTVIDCATHKTKCKEPSWRRVMMSMCEHTCGLCAADACFDAAEDCSSLGHLCFHQAVSPLVRQQCARSCGLCTPQQRAETAERVGGAESREVVGVQKTPKEVIVLVRKNSQITASPKSAICQDVSPSCADNSGLCTDKIYSDFLKDKCAKTCGHCLSKEDKVRLGNDYDSDSSKSEDYDQPFESVRRIRNRPSAAPPAGGQNNSPDNGTTVAKRANESSSRRSKASGKFSERLIIKIGGGDQKEHIELRGKLGETLRISREILLENDEENEDDQAEKKKRKRQKKKQKNLSPLLVILEKAQPNEAEETLPEERGNGFREILTFPEGQKRNGTEIVWTSEETKKEESNVGEIAYGQRQKKKLEKQRESNERENSEKEKELRIESESNGDEEEAEKRGKSAGGERNGDRQAERIGARLKNNERLPENERQTDSERIRENEKQKDNKRTRENERQIDNRLRENERQIDNQRIRESERQIDSMMVEVGNKTTDQNGRNRINSEQLHVGQFTAAKGHANNRIESDASLLRKSTPKEKAKAEKKQTNDQNNEREVITDKQMGTIKQPSDRISEWTRRNPKEEAQSGGEMPNGRILWTKILPVQTSASNKSLPNSADKENIPPTTDGRSLPKLSGDRPFSPKQTPTDEQKKSDGQKKDGPGEQQRTSNTRTKAGNSELSQRILQLLKNLRIAKEAVANYGTGRRRRRKRSVEKIANQQKQGQIIVENGQEIVSDQKSDKKLTDKGQAPLPGQQKAAITGQDFRERLGEEKPPDEKKAEEKGIEEEAKFVVEELFNGQIGEKADQLGEEEDKLGEEEGILDGILVEEEQKEREEPFGAVPEGMVDELVEQQLLKREKDGTKEFVEVIRAVLEEIGEDVFFAGEEEQNQIEEAQQEAQKVPKMREDTAGEEADDHGNENIAEQQMPEVIGSDQLVFGDQRSPSIREDDNDGIDQPLADQQTINSGALPDQPNKSLAAADEQNEGDQIQEAAMAPKLAEFDQENGEENAGSYGRRWSDQSQRINDRRWGNSDEFRTRQADEQQQGSSRKMFDGVLRDRGGRAVRVEDLPGGISGALERVRLRYGFGNGTMEEMLANLLLDTERDIANGLKQILGELRKLEGPAERQRKMPIFNDDIEDEKKKERRKNKMRKMGKNGKRGGKSGSDEETDKDGERSERERKGGRETERNLMMSGEEDKRRNSAISREDIRKKNGERNKEPNDQQDDQTLRQLLKLLMENINKKSSDPSSMEKKLKAFANKKRGQRKAAEVPILDELVELIKKQRTALDRRKEQSEEEAADNWGKAKQKPKPQLSFTRANNRRRRILTSPTRAASSVQSRGPAKTLVLPRRVLLPSAAGGPTPDGYRLVPIIGPAGNQMPTAPGQVYPNGQLGNFLAPSTGANGGPPPVYSLPLPQQQQQQQREGQAVPAAQPQQVPMQPAKQAVVWQQPVYVQFPQQIQQQQTQLGQQPQEFPQQQQQQVQPQQPQTVYVQQQPAQQLQAVRTPLPVPQQQPQIVVQRPAQPPQQQQQFLLPNPQQQPQQNLIVADAAAPAGGMPRAPLLQQPARVSSSSSSRGSYVMLRKNAIGGGNNIVGPKCRDYYPYCEQIVPRGFCISEVYPLRMKREYCPQSCGLC